MKIAVLISGQYREFEIAVQSWKFIPKGSDVDFYMATWNISYDEIYDGKSTPDENGIQHITIERIEKVINLRDFRILPEVEGNTITRYTSLIKNSLQMLINSNIKYDVVMIMRPDLWVGSSLNNSLILLLQNKMINNILYGASLHYGYMNMPEVRDCFWLGNQITMLKFLNLPTPSNYEFGTEKILGQFYIDNNLKSNLIPDVNACYIVRSNCRNIENLTTEIVDRKAIEWWNIKHPENSKRIS